MIGRLSGTLLLKNPPELLLDVGGVGYELQVPMSTFYDLPDTGARVSLLTHLVVREDAHLLYGFLKDAERRHFRELIRISGVGPRIALAVLSGMGTEDLEHAVRAQDPARLTRIPGIGKKTAERLLLELRGRLDGTGAATHGAPSADGASASSSSADDVLRALVALGYSEREAQAAVKGLAPDTTVIEGIRLALRRLARAE